MRYLTVVLTMMAVAGVASAEITMEVVSNPVPMELESGVVHICNDLVITTDTDWLSAVLIVIPDDPAKVYQDAFGGIISPNPAFFPIFPTLEYDTYVSNGVLGEPVSIAFACDQDYTEIEFTSDTGHDELALFFYTTDFDDIGVLSLARVTLADTTTGTWYFRATAVPAGGPKVIAEGTIVGGRIPEPASVTLLLLGAVAMLKRKRKSRA